jgi:regulator of protease activity HflC (stomatin/prohibitin superfamily)
VIQQIIAFLTEWWRILACWAILDQEHRGFIRRLGRPNRRMLAGWNWKWPVIEKPESEDGRAYAYILDPQSLQSGDGRDLVLRLSVVARVANVQRYFLAVSDGRSNIQDVAAGELGDVVASSDAAEILSGEILPLVLARVQKVAKRWGMRIDSVKFVDRAQTQSFRLWQSNFQSAGQD